MARGYVEPGNSNTFASDFVSGGNPTPGVAWSIRDLVAGGSPYIAYSTTPNGWNVSGTNPITVTAPAGWNGNYVRAVKTAAFFLDWYTAIVYPKATHRLALQGSFPPGTPYDGVKLKRAVLGVVRATAGTTITNQGGFYFWDGEQWFAPFTAVYFYIFRDANNVPLYGACTLDWSSPNPGITSNSDGDTFVETAGAQLTISVATSVPDGKYIIPVAGLPASIAGVEGLWNTWWDVLAWINAGSDVEIELHIFTGAIGDPTSPGDSEIMDPVLDTGEPINPEDPPVPPAVPENFAHTPEGAGVCEGGQATLSWDAVEDATGYIVRQDGEIVYEGADTQTVISPLDIGVEYSFTVEATGVGGVSGESEEVLATPCRTSGCHLVVSSNLMTRSCLVP